MQRKSNRINKNCFLTTAKNHFFKEFKTPAIVKDEKFTGTANAIFAVTKEGTFKLIYINTPYPEIKKEVERVFKSFPKVTPAWHSNRPIEMKFNLPITFPIGANNEQLYIKKTSPQKEDLFEIAEKSRIADSSFFST